MNRAMDYRTDYYSLGITFYELLIGRVPFKSDDPMELIHSHIAKAPIHPSDLNKDIPQAISDITLKLLSKNAEERYQSGYGLSADLKSCLNQLKDKGKIGDIQLGKNDISDKFQISQKLYGRENNIEVLLSAFDKISQGETEMIQVYGSPGVGKTFLINEIHKPIVKQKGYFISGKFDQLKRNIPYSALIQAFQGLVAQLLTENEEKIKLWREKIKEALGANGQIIVEVIPKIELIIAKQSSVSQLGPEESQNRFSLVFQKFIRVFSTKERPLVIFLDDLQWVDLASLNLIKVMITDPSTKHLLIIGAYRDNEVNSVHPLMLTIDGIKSAGIIINNIALPPLKITDVNQMIADTLNSHREKTQTLANHVYHKTEGNPFFVKHFLTSLHEEKMLTFDLTSGWQWDTEKIEQMHFNDNVVELLVKKITKLSTNTQQILKLAACIGNIFDLETLAIVYEKTLENTFSDLYEAVQEELVYRSEGEYKFQHDRIQEAGYSLISPEDKKQMHYKIGKLLLKQTKEEDLLEKIFHITDQLDFATELIKDKKEKQELAKLNLKAGQKAKASTAYDSAVKYLNIGVNLLESDTWKTQYDLTFPLYIELAECKYLNGNFEESEHLFEILLKNAKTNLEKADIYNLKIILYTNQGKYNEVIKLGRDALKLLGINIPPDPSQLAIILEVLKSKLYLRRRKIKDLIYLPEMVDLEKTAAIKILMDLTAPAYFISQNLFAMLILKMFNLSLKHGNADVSPYSFSMYGMFLGSTFGDYNGGYEFGKLGLKVADKVDNTKMRCKTNFVFGSFINHWKRHAKTDFEYLLKGFEYGLDSGDLVFAGYSAYSKIVVMSAKGDNLDNFHQEAQKYLDFVKRTKDQDPAFSFISATQMVMNLKGMTKDQSSLSDDNLDEDTHVKQMKERKQFVSLHFYYTIKLRVLYLARSEERRVGKECRSRWSPYH